MVLLASSTQGVRVPKGLNNTKLKIQLAPECPVVFVYVSWTFLCFHVQVVWHVPSCPFLSVQSPAVGVDFGRCFHGIISIYALARCVNSSATLHR